MAPKVQKSGVRAPAGSLVWCVPSSAEVCGPCSACYNCCNECSCCPGTCSCGPPCPGLFFWLPCLCCCCRPLEDEKQVEFVVPEEEAQTAVEAQEEEVSEEAETAEAKGEEEVTETAEVAATTARAAPAPGPRRRVVQKKAGKAKAKQSAAKSQPKMFTGAAAGCPPPPPEACVGIPPTPQQQSAAPLGEGVYLVYKDGDEGGTLYLQWSKDALQGPGVLAYVKPAKEIADFKFTKKEGLEKLCTNLQKDMQSTFVTDRRKYYDGWATFVKQLEAYGGTLTLLPASDLQPPPRMRIITLKQKQVQRLQVDAPVSKEQADLVAVVPDNATKFDVDQMEPGEFGALARNYGALVSVMPEINGR